ncbi:uncharacterized protein LOC103701114 [Phoenix dactylifera]|uniref:Uncharacterized protein LOC103701114 n=1 Tax=Phoenix dactylifera TaxID=42345 RepID=A0A8B7BM32_PHODC|nr:uncharacterized protein LOC103701114 [Phoenix dactylifera]XP_017696818.2 uncharacterized protein LOC103701114 [Phoenix dactylifera]
MVQQMIDKFSGYRLPSSGRAMPAGDKQHPISVKKVALRELPNESRNIITKPPGTSPLPKDKGITPDSVKEVGTKRPQPDDPSSPSSHQAPGNIGPNGHLVYVRRKLETEQGKMSTCLNMDSADTPESRKSGNKTKEQNLRQGQTQEPKEASHPVPMPVVSLATSSGGSSVFPCPGRPITGMAVPEPHDSMVTSATAVQADPPRSGSQEWKERFIRLQMFLKSCDQSSQEEYIRMLRSLSAVGRSRHAVELEKRAIHLLLEEGKELHRMKVLNVLGKAPSKDHTSISNQTPSPLQAQFQK